MQEIRKEAIEMRNSRDEFDGTIYQPKMESKNDELLLRIFIILVFFSKVDDAEGVRHCRDDQHEVHKDNQFDFCRDCPSCAKGFGLTHPCGEIINTDTIVKCKKCVFGVTYSRYHGTNSCHPCRECSPGQVIKTECTRTSDRECDVKCKSKYKYYAGDVKHDCQNCSWCCGTSSDKRQQECIDKGMHKNKQCSIDQALRCRPSTTPTQPLKKKNDQSMLSPKTKKTTITTITTIQPQPTSLPKETLSSSDPSDGGGTVEEPEMSLNVKLLVGMLSVVSVAFVAGLIWCMCCYNSSPNDLDENVRKAEEGQSKEMESAELTDLDDHDIKGIPNQIQSDIQSNECCHGSNPQYRAVERQGSVDKEVIQPATNRRLSQLKHGTAVKWTRQQQSTEALIPTDSCKEVEIGIDAGNGAKLKMQLDKRCLSELPIVKEYHTICLLLACKPLKDCGDYEDVARHYCMRYEEICALKEGGEGPIQALLTWLEARQPNLTVEEFAAALTTKKINRPDVVRILEEYYYCN